MLGKGSPLSRKNKKKIEPTITKPEISVKKTKTPNEKSETKIKIHEPISSPHEPTFNTSGSRLKSPRQKIKRSYDKYIVDLNNYEIIEQLKNGVIGSTNFIRHKKTNRDYTSKTSLFESDPQNNKLILHDIGLLIRIQHPTIIRIQGFSYEDFERRNNLTILMQFISKTSLSDLIYNSSSSQFQSAYDNTKRQIILVGITRGMMILHKNQIIHRDLKPENILIDKNYYPKITDFGLSKIFNSETNMLSNIKTVAYLAPEVLQNNTFSQKSDVYSFGILMFEVLSNNRAYIDTFSSDNFDISNFKEKVINGHRPEFTFPIKEGMKRLIESCWSQNPTDRPTFSELFCKLSLTDEENFIEFEDSGYKPIIDSNDRMSFCLDDVDSDEFFLYAEDVMEDASVLGKKEEIEKLTESNKVIAKSLKEQKSQISYLTKYITLLKEDNTKLKDENVALTMQNSRLTDENERLKRERSSISDAAPANHSSARAKDEVQEAPMALNGEHEAEGNIQEKPQALSDRPDETEGDIQEKPQALSDRPDETEGDIQEAIKTLADGHDEAEENAQANREGERTLNGTLDKNESPNNEETEATQKQGEAGESLHASERSGIQVCSEAVSGDLLENLKKEAKSGNVTTIEIPSSFSTVPNDTFKFCTRLKEARIPASVTRIGNDAFYECSSLTFVEIPATVTSIGDYSFCRCSMLAKVTLPSSLKSIGSHAFSRCASLTAIDIPSSVETIGSSAFSGCSMLKSAKIPSSVKSLEECVFFGCSSLVAVDIPASITNIGYDAFYKCSSLASVSIPPSVESIGKGAFNGCLSLQKVEILSAKIEDIKEYTFFECFSLESIDIPSSVKFVGSRAFGECSSLKSVKIPSDATTESDSFPPETNLIK